MQSLFQYFKIMTKLTCNLFIILSNGVGDLQLPLSTLSDFFLHILLPIINFNRKNWEKKLHWSAKNFIRDSKLDFQRYPDKPNKNTAAGRPRAFKANSMLMCSRSPIQSNYATFVRPLQTEINNNYTLFIPAVSTFGFKRNVRESVHRAVLIIC